MNTQHTPGPWKVMGGLTDHPDVAAVNPEGVFCGSIAFINRKSPEWQANARLMAAAPDLLAALKTIVAARDNYHGGDLVRAVDAALPVIAKAEEAS